MSSFSDYARAVLRADEIVDPRDEDGYREMMRKAFEERGVDCTEQDPPDSSFLRL